MNFIKHSIPLALLAAVRTFAEGVNAEFTVMPRSLICSHFCNNLTLASSDRAIRRPGVPPLDRWWLLLAFNGRSHLRDQVNACWIDDRRSCCWFLVTVSLTSSDYESEIINGYLKAFLVSSQKLFRPELNYCHKLQCFLEFFAIGFVKTIL